jgi:hypothetical protein
LPFILNIGGGFLGLSYKIENISIPCTTIAGCPNFIHGINGRNNLQKLKISNVRYYLVENFKI